MTNPVSAVRLQSLGKRYGDTIALEDVSLSVPPGSVFGLLGPNGAGKTTTIQIIMGLVRPTAGQAWIGDVPVDSPGIHAARRKVGYVPDESLLYDHLTAREFLTFIASLHGTQEEFDDRLRRGLTALGLTSTANVLIRTYSLGMKRKVALLAATLPDPKILVLDEPTGSLDAASARTVSRMIADFRDRGGAVLLATHQMELAERLSDRIGILHGGSLRFEGTPTELRVAHGRHSKEGLEEIFLRMTSDREISPDAGKPLARCLS
ncbi:MAG: ABC transporter ATP-binding protein [Gemmatimonadota bacterium]